MVGHYNDLDDAKAFIERLRYADLQRNLGLGRLRVFEHRTATVVYEKS